MAKNKFTNKKGFALLFSVLISSLLLTIGLSIFSVALKELAISTATRQSIHAFFAADSGREYLLYKDIKVEEGLFDYDEIDNLEYGAELTLRKTDKVSEESKANYSADVKKTWSDSNKTKLLTYIISRGYDTDLEDKVERAIEQSY